jgi:glycerol kinase
LIRATLESIAYQARDVVDCLSRDSGLELSELRVDGGACENDFLMQFQADLLGVPVRRPPVLEVTALGAAALAGLAVGYWSDRAQLADVTGKGANVFEPSMPADRRTALYEEWKRAVERSKGWEAE